MTDHNLSDSMRSLLVSLKRRADQPRGFAGCLFTTEMNQAERNAVRALEVRALCQWDDGLEGWRITGTGREALAVSSTHHQTAKD